MIKFALGLLVGIYVATHGVSHVAALIDDGVTTAKSVRVTAGK
jgi:hypothetical protein